MGLADPHVMGITRESRIAETSAFSRKRIGALERRGGGGWSAPGGGGSDTVTGEVTGTVPGTLTINTTATPQVLRHGFGVAAGTAVLKVQSAAITDQILDDSAHGATLDYASGLYADGEGIRWNIQHGSSGAPVTTEQSSYKFHRYETIGTPVAHGAVANQHTAILATSIASGSKAMNVAITATAQNSSTGTHVGSTNNTDTCAIAGYGQITGSGTGAALGGFFDAIRTTTTSRVTHPVEIQARNTTATAGTTGGAASTVAALYINMNGTSGGNAIDIDNVGAGQYSNGLHFCNTHNGPATEASIRDDGDAPISLAINGQHSLCAISITDTTGGTNTGILFGGDTNLYRVTTAVLRTNQSFHVGTNFRHLGTSGTVGFYGVTAVVRPTAYTQTAYTTATRTHAAFTTPALTLIGGTTLNSVLIAITGTGDDANINNNFDELGTQVTTLRADLANIKQLLNSVIDDLQAVGLLQ
jgi:hypothetical protein